MNKLIVVVAALVVSGCLPTEPCFVGYFGNVCDERGDHGGLSGPGGTPTSTNGTSTNGTSTGGGQNNGFGNGPDSAPGNSGSHNNAENDPGGRSDPSHGGNAGGRGQGKK